MTRASSIDRLEPAIRDEIGRLRGAGATIDQIVAQLQALDLGVSRSAVGRHVQSMAKLGEKMRRSREVALALVREMGAEPASRTSQLNIELMHSAILDLFMKAGDGEEVDANGAAALAGDPEGTMMLAKALESLARARKTDQEFVAEVEKRADERARKAAAAAAVAVAKQRGVTAETIEAIRSSVFGVRA